MNAREERPSDPNSEFRPKSFDDYELTLGDLIRGERATMGRSLLEVQRDLKIKAEYLAAIEDADLAAFETPGFIGGYVKSYARYLGMNADWVYRRFCQESGFSHVAGLDARVYSTKPQPSRGAATPVSSGRRSDVGDAVLARSPLYTAAARDRFAGISAGAIGSLAVLAMLTVGLGYGGWALLEQIQRVRMTPVETALSTTPQADMEEALVAQGGTPTAEALERLYRPQVLDRPILTPRDAPIATLDPRDQGIFAGYTPVPDIALGAAPLRLAGVADLAPLPVDPTGSVPPSVSEVQVVLPPPNVAIFARNPAWVRVSAADGTVLFEKILEPGERYVLPESDEPPTLRAGNSGSLFFSVDGEAVGPAGQGTSVAKNVVLTADALRHTYQPADLAQDPELARLAALVARPEFPAPHE
ncbi:MAG: helix-turn-helix domain-containing protein [Qingshengfaniella sp.]